MGPVCLRGSLLWTCYDFAISTIHAARFACASTLASEWSWHEFTRPIEMNLVG